MMKEKDGVVKIDLDILKKVEQFLKKDENKHVYTSKKHVVNLAIIEFLNSKSLIRREKGEKWM